MITQELAHGLMNSENQTAESQEDSSPPTPSVEGNGVEGMDKGDTEEVTPSGSVNPEEILDQGELKKILEALLFVSPDSLTVEKLSSVLEGLPKSYIKSTIQAMQSEWDQSDRGFQIVEVASGFVMVTRPECGSYIKRLMKAKASTKLSRSALETLAIIGYKQPIIRADIEKIRGVETSGVLRTLLDQKLIRIVGRQEVPGRPILYGTSKHFLQRFGLRDLRDLPPLKELKDLGDPEHLSLELPFQSEDGEGKPHVADLSA